MKFIFILLLTTVVLAQNQHVCNVDYTKPYTIPRNAVLKQAHVINRHGDRYFQNADTCWPADAKIVWNCGKSTYAAPVDSLTDAVGNPSPLFRIKPIEKATVHPGNCMIGSMSDKGHQQTRALGLKMYDTYIKQTGLLSNDVAQANKEVLIRADNFGRTITTAQRIVTGLYEQASNHAGVPVVDLYMTDDALDIINPGNTICPKLNKIRQDAVNSAPYKDHLAKVLAPLQQRVAQALSLPVNFSIGTVYDCTTIHMCNKIYMPETYTWDMIDEVQNEFTWEVTYQHTYNLTAQARMGTGFVLKEWIEQMNTNVHGVPRKRRGEYAARVPGPAVTTDQKLFIYSCHDINVFDMLVALGIFDNVWTPYTSTVIIELWQVNTGSGYHYAIRYLYNWEVKGVPGCSTPELCPYDEWLGLVSKIIPSDDLRECF